MKIKNTNILLGIITLNLTLLTAFQLEIWPTKANASELNSGLNYGLVPINENGSINVELNSEQMSQLTPIQYPEEIAVDLREIGGHKVAFNTTSNDKAYLWIGVWDSNNSNLIGR